MILHITESGYTILGAWSLFMAGVSAAGCGNSKSAIFSISGDRPPLAEPMLFNRTLDAWLSRSETLHSG
ncbi:hypothetical protein BQ1740_3399 [Bacillus subtilis]|nr:hypothetical protein BQ1740_3399 [Bacillus subtilis]